ADGHATKRTSGPVLPCRERPLGGTLTDAERPSRPASVDDVDSETLAGPDREHVCRAPVGDRDRDVLVRVLVEDDVARPGVGKRTRRRRVVAVHAEVELDTPPRDDADLLHVRAGEVQLDVAVTVDVENGGRDPRPLDLGSRKLETNERLGLDRRTELAGLD